ncbi:MAG: hypothetical protein L0215_13850 [Gemmataceae bacterium]|nr:hypothetical protein [Gemmataceae bacterium]
MPWRLVCNNSEPGTAPPRHAKRHATWRYGRADGAIQGTRPQTLGFALDDSPAGLAAWIIDKFWAWSDHAGNLDNSFTKDELLIYWIQSASGKRRPA